MGVFDRFYKREKIIRKTVEIDDKLYEKLKEISKNEISASVNQLINACIEQLIEKENIKVYVKQKGEISIKHTLFIRESFVEKLDYLKQKYDISIYKLVNMSINNALEEYLANKDKPIYAYLYYKLVIVSLYDYV